MRDRRAETFARNAHDFEPVSALQKIRRKGNAECPHKRPCSFWRNSLNLCVVFIQHW